MPCLRREGKQKGMCAPRIVNTFWHFLPVPQHPPVYHYFHNQRQIVCRNISRSASANDKILAFDYLAVKVRDEVPPVPQWLAVVVKPVRVTRYVLHPPDVEAIFSALPIPGRRCFPPARSRPASSPRISFSRSRGCPRCNQRWRWARSACFRRPTCPARCYSACRPATGSISAPEPERS